MVLSRVSKRWRQIAIGHSLLWTRIEISSRRPTESLKSYIQRSGDQPFTITFELSNPEEWKVENVWNHLEREIHQWRRLSIKANSLPSSSIYPILKRLRLGLAPLLEDLNIEVNDDDEDTIYFEHPEPYGIFLAGAPKLTSIRLYGFFLHINWPPLSGVTTLFLHKPLQISLFSLRDLQIFITGFQSLINLSIFGNIIQDYIEAFFRKAEFLCQRFACSASVLTTSTAITIRTR